MKLPKFKIEDHVKYNSAIWEKLSAGQKVKVFGAISYSAIYADKLYLYLFKTVPVSVNFDNMHGIAYEAFLEEFGKEVETYHCSAICRTGTEDMFYTDTLFVLKHNIIVSFTQHNGEAKIIYDLANAQLANEIIDFLAPLKMVNADDSKISLLMDNNGLLLRDMEIEGVRLDLSKNYNDDFPSIHKIIFEQIKKNETKGLTLLYGRPGTGKTTYIRYLVSLLKKIKRVIFIPPNMAEALLSPKILNFILNYPNSVFVIEDAEDILTERTAGKSSAISTLLNLADGLLSDFLNIHIICTFNTDIKNIDQALLRKGRLIAKYEFKELEMDKAQNLMHQLGASCNAYGAMSLADIYNFEHLSFDADQRKLIGFK